MSFIKLVKALWSSLYGLAFQSFPLMEVEHHYLRDIAVAYRLHLHKGA